MEESKEKAIGIFALMTSEEYKKMCFEVLKSDPDVFIKLAEHTCPWVKGDKEDPRIPVVAAAVRAVLASTIPMGKVPAIKMCRDVMGWSLKDAKDFVEAMAAGS